MYLQLDPVQILATTQQLRSRIRERFPEANLAKVAEELVNVTRDHARRSAAMQRGSRWPRAVALLALALGLGVIFLAVQTVHPQVGDKWQVKEVLEALDSALGSLVLIGAAFASVWSLDVRRRRRLCLDALHEMRAMAHIIDMHQLTKDPERVLHGGTRTPSSPVRTLTREQLARYLDYCSEMLALIGKVAALYVQGFPDPVALAAVDDVEDLTGSLSRKVWQKIMLLEQATQTTQPQSPPTNAG